MLPNQSLASLIAQPHVRRDSSRSPLDEYAGLWKGTFRPDSHGGAVPFTMRQEGVIAGAHPVLVFPTRAMRAVAVRLVEASATAYEAVSAPFTDPTHGAHVTLHVTGARRGNRLTGRFALRRDDGSVASEGTFTAARYASAANVNYRW